MPLLSLPTEIILHICDSLDNQSDFSALVRSSRYLYQLLVGELYRNNIRHRASTGLGFAARGDKVKAIKRFLQQGADLYTDDISFTRLGAVYSYRGTPLFWASVLGHTEIARLLLDAGADPNRGSTIEHKVWTPLRMAIEWGNSAVAALLMACGAEIPLLEGYYLQFALWCGPVDFVRLLLDCGADVNMRDF